MWIHALSGFIIMIATIVMSVIKIAGTTFDNPHTRMGIFILCLVPLIVFGGLFLKYNMNRLKWTTNLLLKLKFVHKVTICQLIHFAILVIRVCDYPLWANINLSRYQVVH